MSETLVSSIISGACVIVGSCITAFWGAKTKDDPSSKVGKNLALIIIITVLALGTVFISNQYLVHKIPSIEELNELEVSITELKEALSEKNQEVQTLTGENQELSSTNEELQKENAELNEKLNPAMTALSSLMIKNETNFKVSDSPIKDSLGETYKGGSMLLTAYTQTNYGKADFYLNGNYSTLKNVTFAISEETGGSNYENLEGYVSIYALVDGKPVELATSEPLNTMSKKYVFEDVNVAGVEWLEVRFSTPENYWKQFTGIVANAEVS